MIISFDDITPDPYEEPEGQDGPSWPQIVNDSDGKDADMTGRDPRLFGVELDKPNDTGVDLCSYTE